MYRPVHGMIALALFVCRFGAAPVCAAETAAVASASSTQAGSTAAGAIDGDRFSIEPAAGWKGEPGKLFWYWQVQFPERRTIGSILQTAGDDTTYLHNAPRSYVWQESLDGNVWREIPETSVTQERRTFRLHRLKEPRTVRFLRICVRKVDGDYPALREVEFYDRVDAQVAFPEWCVSVNTSSDQLPGEGQKFLTCVEKLDGEEQVKGQEIRLGEFDERFLAIEPRPLCAFMSGNLTDWCQKDREDWRGTLEVFTKGRIPIWAACGGAQGLAILSEHGVDTPWDCPHCRDPKNPKTPIYTHIRDAEKRSCGDYSKCAHESGPTNVRQTADDPVFAGLPREFPIVESHCGQIEWVPKGWTLVATRGQGAKTRTQCMRVNDRYIYAAQFHFELDGTPESSRILLGNFLRLAREWGGYRLDDKAVHAPTPLADAR